MTYPAATANLVVLWGRWWDHLTKAGVDATITATPLPATGQAGSGSPNLVSLVDQAEIKTAAWTTKPLAASGLWALPLLPTNDAQFGAFGGYRIQAGSEPPFIVEILESTPTMTMTADMIAALNAARVASNAAPIGISVNDVAQAVWVRQAAVLQQPAVAPPAGVLTSDQVVNLVAGVRQLPPGGTPGQVPTPKAGGGYEWTAPVGGPATPPTNPIGVGDLIDQTGHLPRVTIDTDGSVAVDSLEVYRDATMSISGAAPYRGLTQIRGRGNSTWGAVKKPYRLKLGAAAALLGMPADRDWVLLANYFDPLSIRNAVALEIGNRSLGLPWTPRMRFVELVLNDVFLGLYQLGEHVKFGEQRINASKATGTTGLPLSGAYLMEVDQRLEVNAEPGFRTATKNIPIVLGDPDGTVPEHKTYIQQWMNTFEQVLFGASWLDPATGYARLVDRNSFIDWYILNELVRANDSAFYSSCKVVKTRDTADAPGRLYMGPPWDYDNCLNNRFGATQPATGFYTRDSQGSDGPGAVWIARMLGDPLFFAALVDRWTNLRSLLRTGDSVGAVIDRLIDRLSFAAGRDKRKWSRTVDLLADTDALHAWLRTRIAWLSTQWILDTTAPTVPTGLAGTPGNGQAGLSWTSSTDNVMVVKYRIYRAGALIGEPTTTNFVDTGRTNGTAYSYQVSAVDGAGNESAKTTAITVTPASDVTPPTAPTNLTVTPGDAQNTVGWSASTDNVGVVKYRVRRGGTIVGEPRGSTFTDAGLTNGTAYSYSVTALDAAGNESAASSTASGTPAAAPQALASTGAPAISGTPTVGQTLTTSNGTWNSTPDSYTYQWKRGGTVISGATGQTYVPVSADVGNTLTATVTANKTGWTAASATSAATAAVSAAASGGTTETFTGADGAAWPSGWTFQGTTGTIVGNRGRLDGTGDRTAFLGSAAGLSADFDERLTISLPVAADAQAFVGVGAAQGTSIVPANGYTLIVGTKPTGYAQDFFLYRDKANSHTFLQQVYDQNVAATANGYSVRLQRTGSTVRAKLWPAGATEPSSWQISATDADMPAGPFKPFLGVRSNVSMDFDDVSLA